MTTITRMFQTVPEGTAYQQGVEDGRQIEREDSEYEANIRETALAFATRDSGGASTDYVTKRAAAFEGYLRGETDKPDEERPVYGSPAVGPREYDSVEEETD